MLQSRAMLGEETCLLQDSEWFSGASWYVYITAHEQMGYKLNCITEGCSRLTRGKRAPRGVWKRATAEDHTFLK